MSRRRRGWTFVHPLPIMKKINHLGETNRVPLELKSTINLPKTDFPMKANLPQNEPKALARWQQMGIYERIREARQGAPSYILHDGPPYANGPIHLGHALNKCLKDFIVKSKTMAGFRLALRPGMGLSRPAHRNQSGSAAGRQKTPDGAAGRPRKRAENTRKNFSICSASNSSASASSAAGTSPTPP